MDEKLVAWSGERGIALLQGGGNRLVVFLAGQVDGCSRLHGRRRLWIQLDGPVAVLERLVQVANPKVCSLTP
jgi:hypothetical protein